MLYYSDANEILKNEGQKYEIFAYVFIFRWPPI